MVLMIVGWILFSGIVATIASSRGRSSAGWFLLSLVISPLFAGLFLLASSNLSQKVATPSPATHVKCPDCAELVLKEAKVCRHCGCRLVPQVEDVSEQSGTWRDLKESGLFTLLGAVAILIIVIYWSKS
jgi:hypothetical protein